MSKNKGSPSSSLRRERATVSGPAMRIALISWESLYSICVGGMGVHVTELAAALERKGHEVHGLKIYPNPESIAWGLGTLFTNFEWARWMGRNGRLAVETAFTWDVVADKVLSVYRQ